MVKTLTVSIDDWIMEKIVQDAKPQGIGRSEWVRRLLVEGSEALKRSDFDSNEQNATIGVQSYHTYQNGILGNANARTGVTGI